MKTRKRETSKAKRVLSLLLVVLMVIGVIQITSPFQKAKAAVGDVPAHSKNLTDNQNGTYTLSLDVVGDAEKKPNNVNVIVIFDTSGSMTSTRMSAAKNAVNSLANSLFAYNTTSEPNTVQMALIDFSTHASVVSGTPTNSYSSFSRSVQNLSAEGGTNWEAALKAANNVNFGDSDQTFVVFVSDGNPTFRDTQGTTRITDNRYYNYDNIYYSADGVYGLGSDNPNNRNYSPQSMQYCYGHAVDDAQTLATKVTPGNFFTIGAFGNVDRMEQLTDDAGSESSTNYYNASDTAALNQAISDILAKIEMAGIANVEVDDGTTNQVTTTSGQIAELLEVDESSYKYYRSGGTYGSMQPWADAPKAELVDGTVEWDLASVGVLENGVRYTVTFDVYPSQYTYDTIAQLKNGDITYDSLDSEIKKYIVDNGGGNYTLRTNTNASLSYDDTRDDAGQQTASYVNPDPVGTNAQTLTIKKEWEGASPDVNSLPITVMMDDQKFHTATLSAANNWETNSYISVGIIKNGQALPGALGHDFSFAELDDTQYRWELDAPTVRPMLVNGTLTMLVKVDADHPAPSGATTYTIEGATYYVDSAAGGLTATNYRRSNLNLTKVVTGEDAPEDATFPFTLTVNNSKAPATEPTDDPEHNSDYWVWFSIYDTKAGATVTDATVSGATGPNADGYYYAPSGSPISVEMKDGWNLRFTNLPSGTTYTFVEGDLADGFAFKKAELTQGEDSTFSGGKTTTGTIETTKTSFYVTYTNDYQLTDLEITKVWDDAYNQDGKRLTPEQLAEKLTLSPAVEGATPTVTDNDDNTYTISYTGLPRFNNNGQEVTYTVAESAIDGYTTTGNPAEDHGTITNTHTPEVTSVTVVKVWEDNNNIGGIQPASIDVQLTAGGTASGDPVALNAGNKWTYTWENLPKYKEGKEIVYSADETAVPAGYTKTGPEKTTAEDGTITFTVTNTYDPKPVSVDPPVQKVITGKDDLYNNGDFTFTIENTAKPDAVKTAPMPANTSITNSATYELEGKTGYYEFGEIEFTVPGTYTYLIKESGSVDGVTNDPAGAEGKSITFTVKDDGNGNLTVNPTTDQVDLSFTNIYDADGEASIVVNKEVVGAAWPEGKTLTLTITGADGAPMPETTTATLSAAGSVTFGPIAYGLSDAGKTYTYTITEDGFGKGWTGSGDITANVAVTDKGDGTLDTKVTYSPENATFTNTYKAKGEATLEVTKAISGAAWPANKTLTLTVEGSEGAPMPETTTATLTAAGSVEFGPIAYTEADAGKTYTYTIIEDGFGDGWNGDPAAVTATVEVTDNGDGTLGTDVTYSPEDAIITNTYEAEGEAVLEVTKALAGAAWPEGKTLTLTLSGEGGTLPETKTVTLTAAGKATFEAITYDESDAGKTYTYTISEDGFGDGWTGSGDVTATVTVTDNGDGTLGTTVEYSPDNDTITNTYTASGEATLEVTKAITGAEWPAGKSLTISVTGEGEAPMPEATRATLTAPGKATFGPISYDESDSGKTYTYTISEDGFGDGWTGSGNITATVVVNDDGEGHLTPTVTYVPNTQLITNTYKATGSIVLEAKKNLTGRAWKSGETVEFTLYGPDGAEIEKKTIGTNGTIRFSVIGYDESDAGKTYEYTIRETSELPGGVRKSEDIKATVTVTDNHDGSLATSVTYSNDDTIINTYTAEPVKAQINVSKEISGYIDGEDPYGNVVDRTFNFTLKPVDGAPMPEGMTELTTSVSTSGGTGTNSFVQIPYTFEDMGGATEKVFKYEVTETAGGDAGFTYDSKTYTVEVTVTDDQNGKLVVSNITKADESSNVHIVNEFTEEETEVVLTVTKVVDDQSGSAPKKEFTFELVNGEGTVEQTKTITIDPATGLTGSVDFDAIKFTAAGTYEYIIRETVAEETQVPAEGDTEETTSAWTYDTTERKVTIVVNDNFETAILEDSTTIDGEETTSVTITNIYKAAETDATLAVTKEVNDTSGSAYETTFEFTLKDAEGTVLDTKSIQGPGTVEFDPITYSRVGTYNYTITETNGGAAGYTYDTTTYPVVVTVEDQEGKLVPTVVYGENKTELTVINTYDPKDAEVDPTARKVVDDKSGSAPKEQFTFQLIDSEGTLVEEVKAGAGPVNFKTLTFDKVGTFTYTIKEIAGSTPGFTYDTAEKSLTIVVTDPDKDGILKAEVTYGDGEALITNPYEPTPVSAQIDISKELNGMNEGVDPTTFHFTLTGPDVNETAEITGSGTAAFTEITYTKVGTYTYTVTETNDGAGGYTYDTAAYTVKIVVTDEGGKLAAAKTIQKDGADASSIVFVNTYKAEPVEIVLDATKELTGRDLNDGEFSFTATMDGKAVATGKNDAAGKVTLSPIEFTKPGTYTINVTEDAGELGGVTYDTASFEVTVEVVDNGDGTMTATVTGADEIKFVNTYEAEPTKIVLKANKELTGRDLKDGEFEFTASQGENVLAKGKNDKDGNIVFEEIELRYAGTYKFTLKEVIPESKEENMTYDEKEYEVTVTVKDDGNGKLVVENPADGATGVVFKNKYEKPEEPPVVPPTGDHTNIWIWVAIMIAAGLEFASLLYIKLRKKANR